MGAVVLLAVRDLFFRVKLEQALRALGIPSRRLGSADVAAEAAREAPALVILDLGDAALAPIESLRALRSTRTAASVPVIGFAPHADHDLVRRARAAGCDAVVARSRISAALPQVLAPFADRFVDQTSKTE